MTPLQALLLNWAMTALWPIVAKSATASFSAELFYTAGMGIGLAALAPMVTARRGWPALFSRELAPRLAAIGALGSLGSLIYIHAMAYTTPANAGIMAQVEVLYSAVLCAWLLGERLSLEHSLATLLVLCGTGLILWRDMSSLRFKGDLMILATPWVFQLSHIASKKLPQGLDPAVISAGRVFYGLIFILPFCLWRLLHQPHWSWQSGALALLLAQGVGLTSVNFLLWYSAIRRMELAKATTIMLSYPAFTMLFSWALGQEAVYAVQVAGLLMTMAGAAWMSRLVMAAEGPAA